MIKQISIFTENKKGSMREITRVLAEQGISILALVTNDSAEFGIVRMVVSNQELAYDVLKKAGYMVCRICFFLTDPCTYRFGSIF